MPCFWFDRITKKNNAKLSNRNKFKTKESPSNYTKSPISISSISPCSSPKSYSSSANKLKLWWLNTVSPKSKNSTFNQMELQIPANHPSNSTPEKNPSNPPQIQHTLHPRSLKLEDVVSDARGFREFIKFLSLSFSSENMLFIAEVMRFKNFMFMRGLVNFDDIGYYLDLPSKVIDYMWYIPEEYRNLNHARKARKKRRSLVHRSSYMRKSFSVAFSKQKNHEMANSSSLAALRPKSCPAPNTNTNDSKFGFDLVKTKHISHEIYDTPEPPSQHNKESKHQRRIQWMDKQKRKKKQNKSTSDKKNRKKEGNGVVKNDMDMDMDKGVLSDVEDNTEDEMDKNDLDLDMISAIMDEHSVSAKDTPKITAMISPKLLENTMKNTHVLDTDNTDNTPVLSPLNSADQRPSSIRFQLNFNDIDINASDLNDADGELTPNESLHSPRSSKNKLFTIDDFFEGFDDKQINNILITPLEDAQRIRDRYISNGAEFQINLSGGMQYQTLQYFENDPKSIDWKSKMLERKRKQSDAIKFDNHKSLKTDTHPLPLANIPTETATATTPSVPSNCINIINETKHDTFQLEEIEEKKQIEIEQIDNGIKIDDIILRFDDACYAIVKQLLLHEFDRFKHTDDYLAYFKHYQKSQKRLGSIYKKFQKKTSRVLPMNNHQSPQLTYMKQLSLHKERDSPRLAPLKMTMKKAKSASFMKENQYHGYTNSFTTTSQQRSSAKTSRHAAISSNISSNTQNSNKRLSLELSGNLSTTISGIFTLLNAPNSRVTTPVTNSKNTTPVNSVTGTDMEVVMEDVVNDAGEVEDTTTTTKSDNILKPIITHMKDTTITSIGSKNNKLSLIRELPQPVEDVNDKHKMMVITPTDMTPVVDQYGYPDVEMDSDEEDEEEMMIEDDGRKVDKNVELGKEEELEEFDL